MEHLRAKKPEMVRKELYVYFLAYNLLRTLMWEAGIAKGVNPLCISLQRTRQHLNKFVPQLAAAASTRTRNKLYQKLLKAIAHKLVSLRPVRYEPRVQKRRPKAYPFMQKPRQVLRQKLGAA